MGSTLIIEATRTPLDGHRGQVERFKHFGPSAFKVAGEDIVVHGHQVAVHLACDRCGWTHVGAQWRPDVRRCLCGDCVRELADRIAMQVLEPGPLDGTEG